MVVIILNLLQYILVLYFYSCKDSYVMISSRCVDQNVIIGATLGTAVPVLIVLIAVIFLLATKRQEGDYKYKYKYR